MRKRLVGSFGDKYARRRDARAIVLRHVDSLVGLKGAVTGAAIRRPVRIYRNGRRGKLKATIAMIRPNYMVLDLLEHYIIFYSFRLFPFAPSVDVLYDAFAHLNNEKFTYEAQQAI